MALRSCRVGSRSTRVALRCHSPERRGGREVYEGPVNSAGGGTGAIGPLVAIVGV
ncbi:MAG TPA: hypothetical protein VF482_09470 [Trebonia sp.]